MTMLEQKYSKGANWPVLVFGAKLAVLVAMIVMLTYLGLGCEGLKDCGLLIEGTVVDRETALPVDSAWVTLFSSDTIPRSPHDGHADSSGAFLLSTFPSCPKTIDIYAGKSGYKTFHQVIHTGGHDVEGVVIQLEKATGTNGGKP